MGEERSSWSWSVLFVMGEGIGKMKLYGIAVTSRVVTILLASFSDWMVKDYDTSSSLFVFQSSF